jgi:hypothetical protein
MTRRTGLLVVLALSAANASASLSCGHCLAIQESIHRSINANISAYERRVHAGSQTTETIQIGQIIWHVCGSDAWNSQRFSETIGASCKQHVRKHVDMMTEFWQGRSAEEYKDGALSLRMKRDVCTHDNLQSCSHAQLPDTYMPLRPDECSICEAIVSDVFGIISNSRERPKSSKHDNYFRLVGLMGSVCEEMAMRHPTANVRDSQAVLENCQDLWEEHEATFSRMALERTDAFAREICSSQVTGHALWPARSLECPPACARGLLLTVLVHSRPLDLCEEDTPLSALYAHDPGSAPKEEL